MVSFPCPSLIGRVPEAPGQGRSCAPAAYRCREIPDLFPAAAILLVLITAVLLVQAFLLHPPAIQTGTNASASPSIAVAPEVFRTPAILATPPPPWEAVNISPDNIPDVPSSTALLTTSLPSTFMVSVIPDTATGTRPRSPDAPVTGYSKEVPVINATSLEARIHALVNKVRQEHGLSALGTDPELISLARAHSADMAARGYFGHVNLDERDATARGAAAGYTCHKAADPYYTYPIAENLYATYRYTEVLLKDSQAAGYAWTTEEAMAEETVNAWMNSTHHRDNILDPGMGREGIGVAFGPGDMVFITQDFC